MNRAFTALGRGVVRFRWLIIVIWVLGTIVAVKSLPSLGSQVNNDNSQFLPASAPSNQAADLAQPLIGSTSQSQIPVVAVTSHSTLSQSDQTALRQLSVDLGRVPTVTSVRFLAESVHRNAAQLLVTSTTQPFGPTGPMVLVDDTADGRGPSRPSLEPRCPSGRTDRHQRGHQPEVEQAGQSDPALLDPLHHRSAPDHLPFPAGSLRHPAAGHPRPRSVRAPSSGPFSGPTASRSRSSPRSFSSFSSSAPGPTTGSSWSSGCARSCSGDGLRWKRWPWP